MSLGLEAGTVLLHEAHESWALEFHREKARILDAIGAHILDIQHVGSTAIPGVPAKPILDILVGVERFEGATVCVSSLEEIGYTYRHEHGIPRRHYFVKGNPRTHHLHMVERDSEHWMITVRFRDCLRNQPELAREYAEAKVRLAARYFRDRAGYQKEKDQVVESLLRKISALS